MRELVEQITAEVVRRLAQEAVPAYETTPPFAENTNDITGEAYRESLILKNPNHPEALAFMRRATVARVGPGKAGPRLTTASLLALRADHAISRDAILRDVDNDMLESLGLFTVRSACQSRNEHILRPDLGRKLSSEAVDTLKSNCKHSPTVQIYLADGLSSSAVDANACDILPCLLDALKDDNIDAGTPFFMQYGRVGAMDEVSQLLDATVTCVLLGERPGLATANSMSAYIAYRATVGMSESRRTVVSNIHGRGIPPVEAGAYIAGQIKQMLKMKASGVELRNRGDNGEG